MEKEKIGFTIDNYKRVILLTVCSYFALIGVGQTVKAFFPNVANGTIYGIGIFLALAYVVILYILVLVNLYKTAKLLRTMGKLKISPILLVVLTLLSTPVLFLIGIICLGVVWNKANELLREAGIFQPNLK